MATKSLGGRGPAGDAASRIRRFNQRVEDAMAATPPTKEWVRKALRRAGSSRCPVRLRRLSYDIILRYDDDLASLFEQYPDDGVFAHAYDIFVGYQPPDRPDPIDPFKVLTEEARWTDEWGTVWIHSASGVGASPAANPLTDWEDLDAYIARGMPDPDAPGRLDGAVPSLKRHGKDKYFCGVTQLALFERFHCLRGMENAFQDFYLYPSETERLLDALTDYLVRVIRRWGSLGGVDAFYLTDDWGTQTALMISPELWRRFFPRRYRRICDEAHRYGMDLIFHSCGNITSIIPDLIEAGVDVIDPLQPEAMDLARIALEFGGKVSFSGGISDQELVRFSPQQVRDHVRKTIEILGKAFGNAYIAAPSNLLPPDVPLENLRALFEACHSP